MRILDAAFTSELAKSAVFMRHLVRINLANESLNWTDCDQAIYPSPGVKYVPKAMDFSPAITSITGKVDSVTLEVSNVDKAISDLVLSQDIRGSECLIFRVLLDENLNCITTPSLMFLGYLDRINVDRGKATIQVYNHLIKWKILTPRRLHSTTCPWVFKGTECGFTGEVIRVPTADSLAEFTKSALAANHDTIDSYLTDLCEAGTAAADTDDGAGHVAANAFDDNTATYWQSANAAGGHWLRCLFAASKIVNKYTITASATVNYSPKNWTLEGSQDATDWFVLDTRKNYTWTASEQKTFTFNNEIAYLYYRVNISANTSGNISSLKEVELIGDPDQYNDAVYNSTANAATKADEFTFSPITLPADAIDISVKMRIRAKQSESAPIVYYLSDTNITASLETLHTADPGAIEEAQGWNVGTITGMGGIYVPDIYCGSFAGANPSSFSKKGYRTAAVISGTFNPGNWVLAFKVKSNTYYAQKGIVYFRVWEGVNADGTGAVQVTNGWKGSSLVEFTGANQYQTGTITWANASSVTLSARYLFIEVIWWCSTSGGNSGAKVLWCHNEGIGETLTIPDLSTARDLKARLTVQGADYDSAAIYPGSTFDWHEFEWALNPDSGVAWEIEDIEATADHDLQKFGYMTSADASTTTIYVSEAWLEISFDVTDVCDHSADRCKELLNRDNFGGFYHVTKLAQKELWWGAKQKIWQQTFR